MINQHCVNVCAAYSSVGEPQLSKACMKCLCPLKRSERRSVSATVFKRTLLFNEIVWVGVGFGDELGLL